MEDTVEMAAVYVPENGEEDHGGNEERFYCTDDAGEGTMVSSSFG